MKKRLLILFACVLGFALQVWADDTYYVRLTAVASPNDGGNVAASVKAVENPSIWNLGVATSTISRTASRDTTFHAYAKPNEGYTFVGWFLGNDKLECDASSGSYNQISRTITAASTDENKPTYEGLTAKFISSTATNTVTFSTCVGGTYSVSYGSTTVDNPSSISVAGNTTVTLTATPGTGYKFLAWQNKNGGDISLNPVYSGIMESGDIVTPVFVADDSSVFLLTNTNHRYVSLSDAVEGAKKNNGYNVAIPTKIVVESNATLTEDVTIPSNVTLLVPFDEDYTCYTTAPGQQLSVPDVSTRRAFKTLTLAGGVTLTVNGSISVSAKQCAGRRGDRVAAAVGDVYGQIVMGDGSKIILNNGANLYAWGYVTGSGTVTAKSGSNVYEDFQITDYRGAIIPTGLLAYLQNMYGDTPLRVFPFTQYYFQNVECPLTFEYGSQETAVACISDEDYGNVFSIPIVLVTYGENNGMFSLKGESSTITKAYDPANDRLNFDISNGESSVSQIELKFDILEGIDVWSDVWVLPITNNWTLNLTNSGKLNITQDMCMLPGSEITVDNTSELVLARANRSVTWGDYAGDEYGCSLYVYDADANNVYKAAGLSTLDDNYEFRPVFYAPTEHATRLESELTDASIDINGKLTTNGYLYSAGGDANICSSEGTGVYNCVAGCGTTKETYQAKEKTTSKLEFVPINVTPVVLTNEEGVTSTAGTVANTVYAYTNGTWRQATNEGTNKDIPVVVNPTYAEVIIVDNGQSKTVTEVATAVASKTGTTTVSSVDLSNETKTICKDNTTVAATAKEIRDAIVEKTQNNNTLVILPKTVQNPNNEAVNVIQDGTCVNLVVNDGKAFNTPKPFTANNATYLRYMTSNYGTICLPFDLESSADIRFYSIDSYNPETGLVISSVDNVPAGTPAIFKKVNASATSITETNTGSFLVSNDLEGLTGDVVLHGTFEKQYFTTTSGAGDAKRVVDENSNVVYYISKDKFNSANNTVTINPFRAWITFENASGAKLAKSFSIFEGEDAATSINTIFQALDNNEPIYDLSGRKLNSLQKGVNIVGGKKVIVK